MKNSFFLVIVPAFLWCLPLAAQSHPQIHAKYVAEPPKIDGDLSEAAWEGALVTTGDWISYNPLYGTQVPQRTQVRIAYDDRYIYVAFHCLDDAPGKIRTTVSRRDNVFNDDWVGFSLDSNGTGQSAYHLFVNPSGIQMDALNTTASGERFEADFVWDSAARITDLGYDVELRVPLQSIRFRGGDDVNMGILFWRRISRAGISSAWPDMPPGQWVFDRNARLIFPKLNQPRLLELLPSATESINQSRNVATRGWNSAKATSDAGLGIKYGITSNITIDATFNPDFSQVESDAFQVQVNQRFPIFYAEKRPFFMEGMGLFNVAGAGNGDGNMVTAFHTRRITNPDWGSKVTGTTGKFTFGLLSASDASPEDLGNRGSEILGKEKLFNVGRVIYGLGQANYLGAIVSDTEHAGRSNTAVGGDLFLRFKRRQQFSATFLQSRTAVPSTETSGGKAAQMSYNLSDRKYGFSTQVEHYDRNFQMDTAFYNRTGMSTGWVYGELNFYPKDTEKSFVKRVSVFTWNRYGRDEIQNGNERFSLAALRMNFSRQGFLRVDTGRGKDPWRNRRFDTSRVSIQGNMQLYRWLNLSGNFSDGLAIYFDPENPFQGTQRRGNVGFTLQPNQHFSQSVNYTRTRFNRESDGSRVFLIHIVNTRSTYQFNKRFLVRAIEQFDSSRRRLLTDLLASYELIPGTVFHAGYGSLYERSGTDEDYHTTSRGLYFKASYLYRF